MSSETLHVQEDTHPDEIVRRLGLVEQRVPRRCRKSAIFSSRLRQWITDGDGSILKNFLPKAKSGRVDDAPSAVFLVLGHLDTKVSASSTTFQGDCLELSKLLKFRREEEDDEETRQSLEAAGKRVERVVRFPGKEATMPEIGDVEIDSRFLHPDEILHFLLQYLTRSIPNAAAHTGAVVLTACEGRIEKALSQGIHQASHASLLQSLHVVRQGAAPSTAFSHSCVVRVGNGSVVSTRALNRVCLGIASALGLGFVAGTKNNGNEPASRRPASLTAVLFGGTPSVKYDLLECCLLGAEVFVIDGSGGYATELSSLHRRCQGSTVDEVEFVLSNVDSETRTILQSNRLVFIPKGAVADNFSMNLQHSIQRDSTIAACWEKYILWTRAAERYSTTFRAHMVLVLWLGLLSTAFSILQTSIQLMWPDEVSSAETNETAYYGFMTLNITIIVLPISMQLAQTLANRMNAGGRWAAFRRAADQTLREIYLMRARNGVYSPQHLAESKDAEGDNAASDHPPQKILHLRLEQFTNELRGALQEGGGDVGVYDGPIPPQGLVPGDNGFSLLSSDEYVRFRVDPCLAKYRGETKWLSLSRSTLETLVHLFNTLGTLLAALATAVVFSEYNLQAWVALTTAAVSALTRFDHWLMFEWRLMKYNETASRLSSLRVWWGSRGERKGDYYLQQHLGTQSEAILTDELIEFTKQLRSTAEAVKAFGEEQLAKTEEEERSGEQLSQVKARLDQLHISVLSADNILGALENPNSSKGRMVANALVELDHKLEEVVGTSFKGDVAKAADTLKDTLPGSVDSLGTLTDIAGLASQFPSVLSEFVKDSSRRSIFLKKLFTHNVSELNTCTVVDVCMGINRRVAEQIETLPSRLTLEAVHQMLQQDGTHHFAASLQKLGISPLDVSLQHTSVAGAIKELRGVCRFPWRRLDKRTILSMVSPELQSKLTLLHEPVLRGVIKRVEHYFTPGGSRHGAFMAVCITEMAELDLQNNLLSSDLLRVAWASEFPNQLKGVGFRVSDLPSATIQKFVPTLVKPLAEAMDSTVLGTCIEKLLDGTPFTSALNVAMTRFQHEEGIRTQLESILQQSNNLEVFGLSLSATQGDLFLASKTHILRKVRGSGLAGKALLDDLRSIPEVHLKEVLARCSVEVSNSYVGQIFDQLSLATSSVDIGMFLTYEDQTMLLSRLKEFVNPILDQRTTMPKSTVLARVGLKRLNAKLSNLDGTQLEEIIERLHLMRTGTLYPQILKQCFTHANLQSLLPKMDNYSTLQLDRFAIQLLSLTERETRNPHFLKFFADIEIKRMVKELGVTSNQLTVIVRGLHKMLPDRDVASVLVGLTAEVADLNLFESMDVLFGHHAIRRDLVSFARTILTGSPIWQRLRDVLGSSTQVSLPQFVSLVSGSQRPKLSGREEEACRYLASSVGEHGVHLFAALLTSLIVTTPLHIFHGVAVRMRRYDIRHIFRRLEPRVLLIPLIAELFVVSKRPLPRDTSRMEILCACEELPQFAHALAELREVPPQHFGTLIRAVLTNFDESALGALYLTALQTQFLTDGQRDSHYYADFLMAASYTILEVQRRPFAVEKAFDHFDAATFAARRSAQRLQQLHKYIPNEDLAARMCHWPVSKINELFVFFRSRLVYTTRPQEAKRSSGESYEESAFRIRMVRRTAFLATVGASRFRKTITAKENESDGDNVEEGSGQQ